MEVSLQEAAALLKNTNDIVITAHENPDGDAVGSTLGLMHILCDMGKKVQVMIDDDIPSNLFVLKGADGIVRPMERDAGILVVLDTSLDRIGEVDKLVHAGKVLNLDHHRTNDMEAENVYVDSDSAATCEIVYRLASYLLPPVSDSEGDGLTAGCRLSSAMSKAAAMCLYTGLATDTGFFRFSNVTPDTLYAASELVASGAEPAVISESLEVRPWNYVQALGKALATAELFDKGRIAGMFIDREIAGLTDDTGGFISQIRVVDGVDVAVVVKEKEEKICRVSMRSHGADVSRVAARFGGGGHIRAAGCTLNMTLPEAKNAIIAAIEDELAAEE